MTDYSRATLAEADHTARFVAGCYAAFPRFEQFAAYSMFYFAAASYSEMLRGSDVGRQRFLRAADPEFASAVDRLSPALHARDGLAARSRRRSSRSTSPVSAIPAKRNWYPVDLQDTVRGAAKLGVTEPKHGRFLPRR